MVATSSLSKVDGSFQSIGMIDRVLSEEKSWVGRCEVE